MFADTNEGPVELAVPAEVILDIFGALDEVNDDTAAQFYASFKHRIYAAGHNAWRLTNFSAKAISLTADNLTH